MIYIGVTGWGDQDSLYETPISPRDKLQAYAGHFPIVEVDASFYAIQPRKNTERWLKETPATFKFIVKAYQGMTGHQRGELPFKATDEMFDAFIESASIYQEQGKLAMILFQFPPWFECNKENVQYLRYCKSKMNELPCALEFRHQSWFTGAMRDKTILFMREEGWIHSICDEPQAGSGSIPMVLEATSKDQTLIRFHGRNVHGWTKPNGANWREVRYLYRYNEKELLEWVDRIQELNKESKELYILFNNNSGGDAADNAKQLMKLLGIDYDGLAPRQLNLF
ncbi:uncharacterized protein YecE (DUF72 family) [Bacillus mesophilus]|uniref:DUF72 domain-containing protein n=1 Tax=Bacillus mesophilus TaxID=1808955 RepID=A0A6M0Q703_9BACI|nr:DUF72 domain-containing protein [Bacillus mesophilus]MBM7661444.1 uncharacterized protein YecE (DUF72 family) [Bacillus mesophilus]NEY72115.1 DUF72 domain-containing protein [Bacillus mesophilus]